MFRKITTILLFLVVVTTLQAQFRTPEAGRYFYWMFSPDLLSRGMGVGGTGKPSGVVINPASQAFIQRYKIEFSYGVAPGFFSDTWQNEQFLHAGDFFLPFKISGGAVIPTRYANFTIFANYMNMSNLGFSVANNNDLGIGKVGSLYFGVSKDYSDRFSLGFSGHFKISYNPLLTKGGAAPQYQFVGAGGIDLGMIWRPDIFIPFSKKRETNWGWQELELAVTVKDIGMPLINFPAIDNGTNTIAWAFFPMPFTPAVGFSANIFNNGSTYWKFLVDMQTPFFQNLTVAVGTELQIFKLVVLRASYTVDVEGLLEYYGAIPLYGYRYTPANVAFGLSVQFSSNQFKKRTKEEAARNKFKENEFSIDIGARPYHNGFIFDFGCTITIGSRDEKAPEISYIQRDVYVSPNLDGIQDEIIIDLDIKDDRYVRFWKLEIYNESGKITCTIASKEQRLEAMKPKDIIRKFFSPKTGILIPKQIIWDGRDNSGDVVADGTYTFKFFAMDDNKNMDPEGSVAGTIIIDTMKPEVKIEKITNTIFSPDDDGSKDTIKIKIEIIRDKVDDLFIPVEEGDIEDVPLTMLHSDTTQLSALSVGHSSIMATSIVADNIKTKVQVWQVDILDVKDTIIRTYVYTEKGSVEVEWDARDENGNKVPDGVYKIILHSTDEAGNYWEEIISNIIIDTQPKPIEATIESSIFSPNGDSVKDSVGFKFSVPINKGVESWQFEILNSQTQAVRQFEGEGMPNLTFSWDGRDEDGQFASEGNYTARLKVTYTNGNKPVGITPAFTVDVTIPQAKIKLGNELFSPDGDGNKDELIVEQTTSEEDEEWRGTVVDDKDKLVKTWIWQGQPPKKFLWNGKDNNNKLRADGIYTYLLTCTDTAGNKFTSEKYQVKIYTAETPVFVTAGYESFSPNRDKVQDVQQLHITARITGDNKVTSWTMIIKDENDLTIKTDAGSGALPPLINWDGTNGSGKKAPDGFYQAILEVDFEAGNNSQSRTKLFELDTVPPEIAIELVSSVFSPNGDTYLDKLEVLQKGSSEEQWKALIKSSGSNTILYKNYYKGKPLQKQLWNGKDLDGNIQKNGTYKYVIDATDKAGNSSSASATFTLKNVFTNAFLTIDSDRFSPNGDKKYDSIGFVPYMNTTEGIAVYKIEIKDKDQNVVQTLQGEKKLPDMLRWNGKTDKGEQAPDGVYTATLTGLFEYGNRPSGDSAAFILDTTPPVISITSKPEYFSPDNDGVDDEMILTINSSDVSGIKNWKFDILYPDKKSTFSSYSGTGKPTDKIIWKGISDKDDLVESAEDYPIRIYAEDEVGNILETEAGPLLVDILIIKLKDGRLKIKISNIAFKANKAVMTDTSKNKKILDLLGRALRKYRQYTITIEGHANRFKKGLDSNRARTLSQERAKTVAKELSKRGIPQGRMTTMGKGFDDPVQPFKDSMTKEERENLKKNRRVEFYLDKK